MTSRITLRLTICLRWPNTLAMRLSNFINIMILMNCYVEFELSLSLNIKTSLSELV